MQGRSFLRGTTLLPGCAGQLGFAITGKSVGSYSIHCRHPSCEETGEFSLTRSAGACRDCSLVPGSLADGLLLLPWCL
ncbi:MAG: hypothetical protein GX415_07660 [Chloroflexi bacterium]|nr:hypothetical protein [Anaerolineaceae bacterium]NLI45263.1 hypothetical protein [Chloroflexota bacterium]HOA22103.1 hypothetical protein [Anaerolineaceae bacterium]